MREPPSRSATVASVGQERPISVGLLEVEGTVDVGQFWPEGRSDTDTTKVVMNVAPDAIRYRQNDSAPFRPTHVCDHAKVKGRTATAPIKNGKLTIRLQGIDAPELHKAGETAVLATDKGPVILPKLYRR